MEAPMKRCHFIGLDVHGAFCEMAVVNVAGRAVRRGRWATNSPALRDVLDEVPQPRRLIPIRLIPHHNGVPYGRESDEAVAGGASPDRGSGSGALPRVPAPGREDTLARHLAVTPA